MLGVVWDFAIVVMLVVTFLVYVGISRPLGFFVGRKGVVWFAAVTVAWIAVLSYGSTRQDTLILVAAGAGALWLFVRRYRRAKRRDEALHHDPERALFHQWWMYQQDCIARGKTPLAFAKWREKGIAWIEYLQRQGPKDARGSLDFDEWRAAGEPAE
jgi:hypothetical protein